LLRGRAGVAECRTDTVEDAPVKALRQAIRASADPALGRDEAVAEATLADGRVLRAHVTHARGSQARPLTDEELDAKFLAQAALVVPERARAVLRACRGIAALDDVGQGFAGMLP
jgi:hypothetical protein